MASRQAVPDSLGTEDAAWARAKELFIEEGGTEEAMMWALGRVCGERERAGLGSLIHGGPNRATRRSRGGRS